MIIPNHSILITICLSVIPSMHPFVATATFRNRRTFQIQSYCLFLTLE